MPTELCFIKIGSGKDQTSRRERLDGLITRMVEDRLRERESKKKERERERENTGGSIGLGCHPGRHKNNISAC